jgi:hypothetical protein
MNNPIKSTIPGSFAELMSQSPAPTFAKPENPEQTIAAPVKENPDHSVKKILQDQISQQHDETHSVTHKGMSERKHNVVTSSLHEVNFRVWKDTIENTETHNSSMRLTNEENYAVEDMVNELKRSLKVKTSLNEVARLGLLYIIHDFKQNREKSLVYKVKKS